MESCIVYCGRGSFSSFSCIRHGCAALIGSAHAEWRKMCLMTSGIERKREPGCPRSVFYSVKKICIRGNHQHQTGSGSEGRGDHQECATGAVRPRMKQKLKRDADCNVRAQRLCCAFVCLAGSAACARPLQPSTPLGRPTLPRLHVPQHTCGDVSAAGIARCVCLGEACQLKREVTSNTTWGAAGGGGASAHSPPEQSPGCPQPIATSARNPRRCGMPIASAAAGAAASGASLICCSSDPKCRGTLCRPEAGRKAPQGGTGVSHPAAMLPLPSSSRLVCAPAADGGAVCSECQAAAGQCRQPQATTPRRG